LDFSGRPVALQKTPATAGNPFLTAVQYKIALGEIDSRLIAELNCGNIQPAFVRGGFVTIFKANDLEKAAPQRHYKILPALKG